MKEKLLNIKNVLRIIISILIIFSMCKSCAKAYVDINEIKSNLTKLYDKNYITGLPWTYNSNSAWTNVQTWCNNADVTGYFILITGNSGNYSNQVFICFKRYNYSGVLNQSDQSNNSYYNYWSYAYNSNGQRTALEGNFFNLNGSNNSTGNKNMNGVNIKYCYTTVNINTRQFVLNAFEEYGGNVINNSFEFSPNGEEVTINNETVNAIKIQYFVIPFSLGQLPSISGEYYNYILNIYDNNNNLLQTYNYKQNYNEQQDKDYSNGSMIKISNRNIMLSSTRLNYNQVYKLSINVYEDTNTYETYDYLYIFLPINAVISNGIITNTGSGDFDIQENAINNEKIAEENRDFIDNLYNKMFTISGDYINNKIEEIKLNNNISRRRRNRKSVYWFIKWR